MNWEQHSAAVMELAGNFIAALIVVIIGLALSKGAQKLIRKAGSSSSQTNEAANSVLRTIVRYGIFIISAIMILNIFGINTASLLAVLGAAGVAVGLALKDTLGNIAAGIILLTLGTCRKGEYIEFGSFSGTIKEINLFTMIMETPDGIYISAPHSSIWGNPLKNYSRNGKRRMDLSVGIAYSDSVDTAIQVMHNIISAEPRFLQVPAPQVILESMEDSSVKITIRAWAANENYWDIYWDTTKNTKTAIEAAGLHIPFPQRDVHIIQS